MNKKLSKKIKSLPQKPGVYMFQDKSGRILYIGKTVNLRNRVRSHFAKRDNSPQPPLILRGGIEKITDIDWIETDDEKQALLLENELIKKYKPRFNIQWRDDKSYFWVVFSNDEWPRVKIAHQAKLKNPPQPSLKGGRTSPPLGGVRGDFSAIGPFVNGRQLKSFLRNLRKILPYRTCKNPFNKPCLQWHLGLCPAHNPYCHSRLRFAEGFGKASESGNPKITGSRIKCGMTQKRILEKQRKNYLNSLNTLSQFFRLYAGEPIRIEAYDISNIHGVWATGSMIVFEGAKPKKSDYRRFKIKTVQSANDVAMIKEVIKRRFGHPEWPSPDLVLIDGGRAQLSAALQIARLASQAKRANRISRIVKKSDRFAISDERIAIIALAKREEEIYTEYSAKILKLNTLPTEIKLIFQAIRNEAHRFAIFYYRHLHRRAIKTK
jgi:excinuclease ABC subunit C